MTAPGRKTYDRATLELIAADQILSSREEVAAVVGMHPGTMERYLKKYPFGVSGVAGKINGRWRVSRRYVLLWWDYVQRQELRHPEARRARPETPPADADMDVRPPCPANLKTSK